MGDSGDAKLADFILLAATQLMQAGEIEQMKPHLPRALELARRQNRPGPVCAASRT